MTDITAPLCRLMERATGAPGTVANLVRLTGGANMESSAFDYAGAAYVLRRAPSAAFMAGRAFGHDVEAAVVRAACAAGVKAPEIVAELSPDDGIGTGYVMRRVMAEVSPAKILAEPPAALIHDIARELARIHAIRPRSDLAIPAMDAAAGLAELAARFQAYGGDRPIIALAIEWCADHLPEPAPAVLVHGDFRMGNLMAGPDGLEAVLDWELVHWGDAHEDLAWGCVGAWQFGNIDRPAFGCSDLETYFTAYAAAGGCAVDRDRFRFWLIYRTLWWALGCLQMGEIWRSGADKSLERAVIARRTSENELDLLMLLEADAPETQRLAVRLDPPPPPRRMGETSTLEMLEAITDWIVTDIKPRMEGHDRFKTAVALNALGMITREAANPVVLHDKTLADDILEGRLTLATPGLLAKLRKLALAKLGNDVPKYAGLARARETWAA